MFRHVSEDKTRALVDFDLAMDAARAAFAASADSAELEILVSHGSDPRNRYTVKPTHGGVKIGTYWPGNDAHGIPRHHSTLLIFDQETGRIAALLDMGAANAYRTAAADALAVDLLARPDSSTLALFGGGHQAPYNARAIARVRPIGTILVVARNPARAVAELVSHGLDARPASAEQACAEADVISTATTATDQDPPLFQADWVRPGTHVSAMGADGPGKRELPGELLDRALLFCDQVQQSRRFGEFQHAPATAALATLGDVLTGRASGRRDENDITIFDSSGIGLQDLHLGLALLRKLDSQP